MQLPFVPGDQLHARGRIWRLRSAVGHRDCVALDLDPADAPAEGSPRVLLHPFDKVAPVSTTRPAIVRPGTWWRALGWRVATVQAQGVPGTAASAAIHLLPFQLEPAIAVLTLGARRVLLADEVGLGKTIQAGLILAELLARRLATRALVLVPAGLRDQWARELRDRFALEADVVDGPVLRGLALRLPRTVNPWLVPHVAVVSIDFARRAEVRLGLSEAPWDVVVIDEAHAVAADSERYRAAHDVAVRARHVVLVTATPHDGRDAGFEALTSIGASPEDGPLVMFRRARRDVGLPSARRTRVIRVRLDAEELAALNALLAYARRLWARPSGGDIAHARPVALLLLKRALSNPESLLRSLLRRRALLSASSQPPAAQLSLPLDDDLDPSDDVPADVLASPGLTDVSEELAWLDALAAAARRVAAPSGKLRALVRLLRRAGEPAIVFTEYRDTLIDVEACLGGALRCVSLHGGLSRIAREDVLRRFGDERADILLSTDAAGTGLNLHHRCRLVVNLELPWNPLRLEQRAGRVDRIGQRRSVHAIHLIGRATPEERLLVRLAGRAGRARSALGDDDPGASFLGNDEDTGGVLMAEDDTGSRQRRGAIALTARAPGAGPATLVSRVDLTTRARDATRALEQRRRIREALERVAPARRAHGAPGSRVASPTLVAVARARRTRPGCQLVTDPGIVAIFEVAVRDHRGRSIDVKLVPFRADVRIAHPASRAEARALAARLVAALPPAAMPALDAAVRGLLEEQRAAVDLERSRARARDRRSGPRAADRSNLPPMQFGLFDARAERERQRPVDLSSDVDDARSGDARASAADLAGPVVGSPRLAWILIVTTRGREAAPWTT